jgi:hypothetical protein
MVLNAEQLDQLRAFIRKKGFGDPVLQEEILDHFASKTEELLSTQSELRFEDAMLCAYRSFGVRGFRPLAENFEKNVLLDFRRWRRNEYRQLLTSIHLPGMLLVAGFFISLLYIQTQQKDMGAVLAFLSNPFHAFSITGFVIEIVYNLRVLKKHRKSYTLQVVRGSQFMGFNFYLLTYIAAEGLIKLPGFVTGIILFGLGIYLTASTIIRFRYLERLTEKGIMHQPAD